MKEERSPVLTTRALSHHFGQVIVADNINLTVHAGERIGIVGPN
ncbi:MAG: ABC transporter ATP-binding protein, partial [Chloroflexi bacterium]